MGLGLDLTVCDSTSARGWGYSATVHGVGVTAHGVGAAVLQCLISMAASMSDIFFSISAFAFNGVGV